MDLPTQKRKKIVKQAVANDRLESLKYPKGPQQIAGSYIAGKASAKGFPTQDVLPAKLSDRYENASKFEAFVFVSNY